MEEAFPSNQTCGICGKLFELRVRVIRLPLYIREIHGGWNHDEPVLVDSDEVEYVHVSCLLVKKP